MNNGYKENNNKFPYKSVALLPSSLTFMAKEINLNELLDNLYNADIKNKSEIN